MIILRIIRERRKGCMYHDNLDLWTLLEDLLLHSLISLLESSRSDVLFDTVLDPWSLSAEVSLWPHCWRHVVQIYCATRAPSWPYPRHVHLFAQGVDDECRSMHGRLLWDDGAVFRVCSGSPSRDLRQRKKCFLIRRISLALIRLLVTSRCYLNNDTDNECLTMFSPHGAVWLHQAAVRTHMCRRFVRDDALVTSLSLTLSSCCAHIEEWMFRD